MRVQDSLFSVMDKGAGIPEKVLGRLGEPFNASASSGTGLGLAWVKTLCDRNHWNINIATSNEGTRIDVDFS